jgi:hypothetical protein
LEPQLADIDLGIAPFRCRAVFPMQPATLYLADQVNVLLLFLFSNTDLGCNFCRGIVLKSNIVAGSGVVSGLNVPYTKRLAVHESISESELFC